MLLRFGDCGCCCGCTTLTLTLWRFVFDHNHGSSSSTSVRSLSPTSKPHSIQNQSSSGTSTRGDGKQYKCHPSSQPSHRCNSKSKDFLQSRYSSPRLVRWFLCNHIFYKQQHRSKARIRPPKTAWAVLAPATTWKRSHELHFRPISSIKATSRATDAYCAARFVEKLKRQYVDIITWLLRRLR